MPKDKVDEWVDIAAFISAECAIMDEYFAGTNTETAYFFSRYCGLRAKRVSASNETAL